MPSKKPETVSEEYEVRNEVESQSPKDQLGRMLTKISAAMYGKDEGTYAGRPVILVYFSRI
jgi:hypothetical protein